jgi:hypothetical protein
MPLLEKAKAELDWKEATFNGTIREMIVPTYAPIIPEEPKFSSTARTSSHMGVNLFKLYYPN